MSVDAAKTTLKEMTERAQRAEKFVSLIANQQVLLLREEPTRAQIEIIKKAMNFESDRSALRVWDAVRKAVKDTNPKVDDLL